MTDSAKMLKQYGLFVILYVILLGFYLLLTYPHTVPAGVRGTAADPATFMTPLQLRESEALSVARFGLYFLSFPWEWGIYVILLAAGLAHRWQERLRAGRLPRIARFPVYTLAVVLFSDICLLPIRLTGYLVSRHFGITIQPVGSWLHDRLLDYAIGYLTVLVAGAAALWCLRRGGRWWVKLWLLSVPVTVFMMYIQPVLVDPLYNNFSRMSDPVLEQKILQLAARADVPANRVYEVHMKAKTNAMNAYVSGIGPTLRIVIWDTTLEKLDDQEILQVVAHEIGHYKMHHLEWSAIGAVFSSLLLLWVGSLLLSLSLQRWGTVWGIGEPGDYAVLPLLLLLLALLGFGALPISNAISRSAEHAADQYALKQLNSADGAVSLTQKMAAATLDDVNPPLLVKWFWADHPSDMERIRDAELFRPAAR